MDYNHDPLDHEAFKPKDFSPCFKGDNALYSLKRAITEESSSCKYATFDPAVRESRQRKRLANIRHLYRRRLARTRNDSTQNIGLGIGGYPVEKNVNATQQASSASQKSRLNAAQWIEKKIWEYSSSGSIVRRWTLEIISWTISFSCMATIIILLIIHENKSSPTWPMDQILNILSRVASAALILPVSEALGQLKWNWFKKESKQMWDFEIFDNASRGPMGSALLLVRTKGRTLASLGAAVTLLALALDPFFQQVVDFPQRWVMVGTGSVPRTRFYQPASTNFFFGEDTMDYMDDKIARAARLYLYGIGPDYVPSGNGTRPGIPLSCPTSNCTWEPYETIGFCSACQEVTELLTFACRTGPDDWTYLHRSGYDTPKDNATMCGYFLNATSEDPVFMSGYTVENNSTSETQGQALLMRTLPLATNPMKEPLFGGSIHFQEFRNPFTDFIVVSATNGTAGVYRNETPTAHECVFTWCVKTLRSSYYWGSYEEEVLAVYHNTTKGDWPWHVVKETDQYGGVWRTDYLEDVNIEAPDSLRNSSGPEYLNFGLSNETSCTASYVWEEFLPSTYTAKNAQDEPRLRYNLWTEDITGREINNQGWAKNIHSHVSDMATAMTNAIRTFEDGEMISGPAFDMETFVLVNWPWLTLPLLILTLSAVFLVGTVMKTSKDQDQVGVWKTSAMATLLYGGLPADIQQQMKNDSRSLGTPRTKARKLKARLLPNSSGWRISENYFSPSEKKEWATSKLEIKAVNSSSSSAM